MRAVLFNAALCLKLIPYLTDDVVKLKAFMCACRKLRTRDNNERVIEQLLPFADAVTRMKGACYCAHNGELKSLELLHAAGVDMNRCVLYAASSYLGFKCLPFSLSHGCAVNYADEELITPLLVVLSSMNLEHLISILDFGANVNQVDSNGDTPLLYALQRSDDPYIVRKLLDRGADVKVANKAGQTALMFSYGKVDELLIAHGADPNDALRKLKRKTSFAIPYAGCSF